MLEPASTTVEVALLAPVPLEHLISGAKTLEKADRVAFGSCAWEKFRELDALRNRMPVDVYIYASYDGGKSDFLVSWRARYLRHVDSIAGAHPAGMKFRPQSTSKYPLDNADHWAVFWEVDNLRPLQEQELHHVGELIGYGKKKAYGHSFAPEGPLLIEHPLF